MIKRICGVWFVVAMTASAAEISPGLKTLQGKWTAERTNSEGRRTTVVVDIKEDKLTFRSTDANGQVRLVAKGTVKSEKVGAFRALTLTDLKAGDSEEDLEPVDDERSSVYILRDGKLFLATGFDKARDNERPRIDEYTRDDSAPRSSK